MSDEEDDVKDPQACDYKHSDTQWSISGMWQNGNDQFISVLLVVIKECDVISAVRIVLRRFIFYSSGF